MSKLNKPALWMKNSVTYFKQFCSSTSIHGFRYLGERINILEKIFWAIIIAISFTGCTVVILKTYRKWELSPVIVSFATTPTPIYHLPFPAVTICPDIKFRRKFYNYTVLCNKKMDSITLNKSEQQEFEYMTMVCDQPVYLKYDKNTVYKKTFNEEIYTFMKNATPDFLNYWVACKWMDDTRSCDEYFTPILTDEGLCYTFNMLDRTELFHRDVVQVANYHNVNQTSVDWNAGNLQYHSADLSSYPRRALFSGAKSSFSIWITALKQDIDYLCKVDSQGFRVLLHHPATIPRMSYQYFRVPLDQSVIAAVRPVMIKTSETLTEYSPAARGCFYPKERKLKYYSIYTQDNCFLECLTNFTLDACNCTGYFMPRKRNEPICGMGSFTCMKQNEIYHPLLGLAWKFIDNNEDLIENVLELVNDLDLLDCNCLPACTSVEYNVEISQSDWDWPQLMRSYRRNMSTLNENNIYMSNLEIFLKTNQIIPLERNELYGPTDFLANFGGLLGLFVGFSAISFVEIFYYLTIRLACYFKKFGCRRWKIKTEKTLPLTLS